MKNIRFSYSAARFAAKQVLICSSLLLSCPQFILAEFSQHQNVVLSSTRVSAQKSEDARERSILKKQVRPPTLPYRGWSYLVEKLRQDGITEKELRAVYSNVNMPKFTFISFALRPREHHALYSHFRKESKLEIARNFISTHQKSFDKAQRLFKVQPQVIAAILLIETHMGQATGRELVINRLSRLASIGEPTNLLENYKILAEEDPKISFKEVQQRAHYLEDTFYPEVRAMFELARTRKVAVLQLRGSSAGAFGFPQFLPSSYLRFAVDGNSDGTVSLFHEADAIWSIANYLSHFGWGQNSSKQKKREVIWKYNHSDAYVDAVLDVAALLQ